MAAARSGRGGALRGGAGGTQSSYTALGHARGHEPLLDGGAIQFQVSPLEPYAHARATGAGGRGQTQVLGPEIPGVGGA